MSGATDVGECIYVFGNWDNRQEIEIWRIDLTKETINRVYVFLGDTHHFVQGMGDVTTGPNGEIILALGKPDGSDTVEDEEMLICKI